MKKKTGTITTIKGHTFQRKIEHASTQCFVDSWTLTYHPQKKKTKDISLHITKTNSQTPSSSRSPCPLVAPHAPHDRTTCQSISPRLYGDAYTTRGSNTQEVAWKLNVDTITNTNIRKKLSLSGSCERHFEKPRQWVLEQYFEEY